MPSNWQVFLRIDENKTELYESLAEHSMTVGNGKQVISTQGKSLVCSQHRENIADLSPCEQEEADTRILLHTQHVTKRGYNRVIIVRTVDTDIVVLSWSRQMPQSYGLRLELGKVIRYLSTHSISHALGKEKSRSLPRFHAFTGCHPTSSFTGKGRKAVWSTWGVSDDATEAVTHLTKVPTLSI